MSAMLSLRNSVKREAISGVGVVVPSSLGSIASPCDSAANEQITRPTLPHLHLHLQLISPHRPICALDGAFAPQPYKGSVMRGAVRTLHVRSCNLSYQRDAGVGVGYARVEMGSGRPFGCQGQWWSLHKVLARGWSIIERPAPVHDSCFAAQARAQRIDRFEMKT